MGIVRSIIAPTEKPKTHWAQISKAPNQRALSAILRAGDIPYFMALSGAALGSESVARWFQRRTFEPIFLS